MAWSFGSPRLLACFLMALVFANPSFAAEDVELRSPFGIAVKPDGAFYVSEIEGRRVTKFDAEGNRIGAIERVEGYGELKGPFDVELDSRGRLYIADTKGNSVLVLDADEKLVLKLGTGEATAKPGSFHQPHFVAVDEQRGLIYVADTHNHRIQVFNQSGELLRIFGEHGRSPGQFHYPAGLAVDERGHLFAMNWSGAFVNEFDPEGKFLQAHGQRGSAPGEFNDAYSVVHHQGSFWVVDTFNSRLQKFSPEWEVTDIVDHGEGTDIHQLNHPTDLGVDGQGYLYVADWKNDRVLKLAPDGHFQRQWGGPAARMAYEPPQVYERDPARGPRALGVYSGIAQSQVDMAAENGVDWIYVSFANQDGEWNVKEQVDYAHLRGVKVAPSIAIYPLGAKHPRWADRPDLFMWKRGGTEPTNMALSYVHPEVRRWKAQHIAEQVRKSGVDGVLLDYIRYPNPLMGYDPAMLEAFREQTGLDANELAPDDERWLQFRAKYIALFISELRYELAQLDRPIEISVYVGPDWRSDLQRSMRNWRDWTRMGIVDKLVLGIYTRDLPSLYEGVRQARATAPEDVDICIMIACWGGNLNRPELLKRGAEVSFAADADEVAIYRIDAIQKLELWPTIGEIAEAHKQR